MRMISEGPDRSAAARPPWMPDTAALAANVMMRILISRKNFIALILARPAPIAEREASSEASHLLNPMIRIHRYAERN
jgi:hypothetical protein